jgi:hypothetical protein
MVTEEGSRAIPADVAGLSSGVVYTSFPVTKRGRGSPVGRSPAHYARLSDKTVREHWEKARKVSATGQAIRLSPDGPVGDAAWAKHRLSRATQALPNGYCQLPLVKTCPHANSCLTCPMFVTTPEFLPQHHAQRKATLQIITAAEAAGHARVAEMNKQVAVNLDKIITALEVGNGEGKEATADAS